MFPISASHTARHYLSFTGISYQALPRLAFKALADAVRLSLIKCTVSFHYPGMSKRSPFDSNQVMRRAEDLIQAASNRYRITVQVANRAQRRRFEEFDNLDDPKMKPVLRAIIEMSDELTQPEIIGE